MSVKTDIKYNDAVIDSLTSSGSVNYATTNKYLEHTLSIEFTGTDDATVTSNKMLSGYTAYGADGNKTTGTIPTWNQDFLYRWEKWSASTTYTDSTTSYTLRQGYSERLLSPNTYVCSAMNDYYTPIIFNADRGTYTVKAGFCEEWAVYTTSDNYYFTDSVPHEMGDIIEINQYVDKSVWNVIADRTGEFSTYEPSQIDVTQHTPELVSAVKGDTRYADVESNDPDTYPINGYQNGYWYIRLNATSVGTKPAKTAITALYTGNEITNNFTCPDHVTKTGTDKGTTVGVYTAEYTPNTTYSWADGDTSTIPVTLEIEFPDYLCLTANTAGSTVKCPKTFEYSTDRITWSTASTSSAITLSEVGSKIYLRNGSVGTPTAKLGKFVMTGSIAASGNIMSLIDNTCQSKVIPCNNCFSTLFYGCTALTSAPELPAITLTTGCYYDMFSRTSIVTPPALPAITLAKNCYNYMFIDCTKLVEAPALIADELTDGCYWGMFQGCEALTTAPELPATVLKTECYYAMFRYCKALDTIPKLPATTLATDCYGEMFSGCKALQVSDTQTTTASYAWTIPTSGTFISTYSQTNMFINCAGTRSSNDLPGAIGGQYTYYTQNPPV